MSPALLDLAYLAICTLTLPLILYKLARSPRLRMGWRERLGCVPILPPRHRLWVHCASVGEALLARSLVSTLKAEYPDADIVFSSHTNTGKETIIKNFPASTVFYFPLDFSPVVRKVFARVKPSAVVLVELELWPNFLARARRLGIPAVVVNGRITERSGRRYRWLGPVARRMFRRIARFAVQSQLYAARLERLGVDRERIVVAGTVKYDTVATDVPIDVADGYRTVFRLQPDDHVLIGGCTHPGEDELLIDYLKQRLHSQPKLRLILAPRHRERADAVESLIRAAGLLSVRKTALDAQSAPASFDARPHVILLDTTGELARVYAVATIVFVGGSLIPHGGQNMIEPAALGKPVVFGPNTWNFRDTVELLAANDAAVEVHGAAELPAALDRLLADPARRTALGSRARSLVQQSKGATRRNFDAIQPILESTRRRSA